MLDVAAQRLRLYTQALGWDLAEATLHLDNVKKELASPALHAFTKM